MPAEKVSFALERAAKAGIETSGQQRIRQAGCWKNSQRKTVRIMIVLAGYMKVLSPEIIEDYRNRIINIHPSLIPKYCGKGFYGITGASGGHGRR